MNLPSWYKFVSAHSGIEVWLEIETKEIDFFFEHQK